MEDLDNLLALLCGPKKLDREKGLTNLKKILEIPDVNEGEKLVKLKENLISLLQSDESPWETKQGCLSAAKVFLPLSVHSKSFMEDIKIAALNELSHSEARVRLTAGDVMGELCRLCGSAVYEANQEMILNGIRSNLERIPLDLASEQEKAQANVLMEKLHGAAALAEAQVGKIGSSEQIFHDTAGWKNLETWMRCLQAMVEGCGTDFLPFITQSLLDLIFQTLVHTNRFVRETGYYVCGAMVSCGSAKELHHHMSEISVVSEAVSAADDVKLPEDNTIVTHGQQFSEHLANGLADNWSQVRLAASVATRAFLTHLPSISSRNQFYPLLLPRMCLNRYYVAEGVRLYSQETWRIIAGDHGKEMVEEYIKEVVDYYILQTDADNHAVREAACACIAELGSKIDKDVVRPYISQLLQALIICFKDDSWPVRDAACVASGNFILCFPDEANPSMQALFPLFYINLQDNISSVRQGAALALAKVAQAYGDETQLQILSKVLEGVQGVQKQPGTSEKYGGMDKSPATFGVVKMLRDNDMDLHSNKQMYSCGSLAPKMGRGREGGCMDHKFRKPSEPWEMCDGCVMLLSELSCIPSLHQKVSDILPSVSNACHKTDYPQHLVLWETVCKQLPVIARNIGKRYFKPNLEGFFVTIFDSLSSDNALTSTAAEQCLVDLAQYLGPNILKGRVEQYKPSLLDSLLRVMDRNGIH